MSTDNFYSYTLLRKTFLDFFNKKGHTIVPSSSLIPQNDPTLLFTNAGMVQFKDVFLGSDNRAYARAASAQRCVRAGGKHNDLENVGYTARHHTFFEMLGNFSFGDYFKREAIAYAWEFLTVVLKLPSEKLWVTVYEKDDEAADIWLKEIKINPQRFSRCGAADNFWSMGDTGPCGPCTEIFYDHGSDIAGGPPGSAEADGDRYVEIWNLVFMQYNRNEKGEMTLLPKPSVDTGCGLERLAAVMQGVHSNYDTDLFTALINATASLAKTTDLRANSLRVIADHIRSTSFLICDGVIPSNEGRGYVLRRIIRRAIRHGNQLGIKETFFHKLVKPLAVEMGSAYPELIEAQAYIEQVLLQEEEQFAKTLEQGLKILETDLAKLSNQVIPGDIIFKLYDTYGFPPDLTADIARERSLAVDLAGFEREMSKQRQLSQESGKFDIAYRSQLATKTKTEFLGYKTTETLTKVCELFYDGNAVSSLEAGQKGAVILDATPFYPESGGQVGDKGILLVHGNTFEVSDTQRLSQTIVHYGQLKSGSIKINDVAEAVVDLACRSATASNHTATHLLHAALRKVVGSHVMQKGSLVEAERLRFDFAHYEPLTETQVVAIEKLVNAQIRANLEVTTEIMSPKEAFAKGAIGLFGEKYGEEVRVLNIHNFSVELCGGTHVKRTGDIAGFKIISETGVAAGVRRIEAITGVAFEDWLIAIDTERSVIASLLKSKPNNILEKLKQVMDKNRVLEKLNEQLQTQLATLKGNELLNQAQDVNGIKVLAVQMPDADTKELRNTVEQLKQKLSTAVVVLGSVMEGHANVVIGVTKNLTDSIKANELASIIAKQLDGKGGGRPDMAQIGGGQSEQLPKMLSDIYSWMKSKEGL